ncbi:MAG: hypothetical protein HY302_10545 [Opitutae bacterium]|nr:hypothetical protein [Opitutae bacterium]
MPGGFTITFDNQALPTLLRVRAAVQRPDIRKVMGRGIATRLRKHYTKLDAQRANKQGGTRTHFYAQARRGVQQPELVGGDGVKVVTNHVGIAQRYFGGEIRPKTGKFLTLPVAPAAYGHRAREFNDLHAIYFSDGSGILVRDNTETKSGVGEIYFRLVKSVAQKPDPSVLPTEAELTAAAVAAGDAHMKTLIERGGIGSI